jgi:hypothetical protein
MPTDGLFTYPPDGTALARRPRSSKLEVDRVCKHCRAHFHVEAVGEPVVLSKGGFWPIPASTNARDYARIARCPGCGHRSRAAIARMAISYLRGPTEHGLLGLVIVALLTRTAMYLAFGFVPLFVVGALFAGILFVSDVRGAEDRVSTRILPPAIEPPALGPYRSQLRERRALTKRNDQ